MLQDSLEKMLRKAIEEIENEKIISLEKDICMKANLLKENFIVTLESSGRLYIEDIIRCTGIDDAVLSFFVKGKKYVAHFKNNIFKDAGPIEKYKKASRKNPLPPRLK